MLMFHHDYSYIQYVGVGKIKHIYFIYPFDFKEIIYNLISLLWKYCIPECKGVIYLKVANIIKDNVISLGFMYVLDAVWEAW